MSPKKEPVLRPLVAEGGTTMVTSYPEVTSPPTGLSPSVALPPPTGVAFNPAATFYPNETALVVEQPGFQEVGQQTTDENDDLFKELSEILNNDPHQAQLQPHTQQQQPQSYEQEQPVTQASSSNQFFVNTPMVVAASEPPTPVYEEKKVEAEEVLGEVTLPVSDSGLFEHMFDAQCAPTSTPFVPDPMMAVNPMEVENLVPAAVLPDLLATDTVTELTVPVANNVVQQETKYYIVTSDPPQAPVANTSSVTPPLKKKRKLLPKLIMPEKVVEQPKPILGLDTPSIDAVMAKNADESNFDLLAFVTNETLDPTDPSFLNLVGDTTPTAPADLTELDPNAEVDQADELYKPGPSKGKRRMTANEKRGKSSRPRGRPPCATVTSASTSRATSYNSSSAMTADDVKEAKYRRMRDLNNEASKRCRQNRKRKFAKIEEEEEELRAQNRELKAKCRQLEDLVGQLKRRFIEKVANPKREALDLNVLLKQRLSAGI